MRDADRKPFADLMGATLEYYDRAPSMNVVEMYWNGLADLSLDTLRAAINAHMQHPVAGKFMPKIADVRAALAAAAPDDGRPGIEAAWAMCPRDESATAVWTSEMSQAFFEAADPLLSEGDEIAARMAFKEAYGKLLADARAAGAPVVWNVSLGHDVGARESVLMQAAQKGRIPIEYARRMLPYTTGNEQAFALIEQARAQLATPVKQLASQS